MNVTRVCELAAVAVACRHDSTVAIGVQNVTTIVRWCTACGSLRSEGEWLRPAFYDDLGRHLIGDTEPAPPMPDPRQIPLPLGMRRRRRRA